MTWWRLKRQCVSLTLHACWQNQAQTDTEGTREQLKAERDHLKMQVEGSGASLAKAHKEVVQEYRANFKETNDYLALLNNVAEEYKASLKRVNLDFDAEYYNRLILKLEKSQTLTPEDPIGFD